MVDNVAVTPGTGATFATDDIGGIQYPRVKIAQGADGTGVDVSSAAPLNVTLANGTVPSHAVTNAGTFAVQVTSAPSTAVTNAGTFATQATLAAETTKNIGTVRIGDGTDTAGVLPASTAPVAADTALVVAISPNGQNANGQATMANSTPVVMASDQSIIQTAPQPLATGGLSVFRSLDLDETEEEVKATAGCLYKIRATNRTTSARYLKLYNATAASTTVGTTTPLDTIVLPAGGSADLATVVTESFGGLGLTFSTALSMAVTTGFADNDTGAPGANDVIVSAYYK